MVIMQFDENTGHIPDLGAEICSELSKRGTSNDVQVSKLSSACGDN